MKIVQIMPAPPGTSTQYKIQNGEREAPVVGYALLELPGEHRVIRPVIDWGQPYGVPDILTRDGNVILEVDL